jgi:hypothetical protein
VVEQPLAEEFDQAGAEQFPQRGLNIGLLSTQV